MELLTKALAALGMSSSGDGELLTGSRSQAVVYRWVPARGDPVVLKIAAGAGQDQARHELGFYVELAGDVPIRTPTLLNHVDTDDLTALVLSAHEPGPPAREWSHARWLEIAGQLALLHEMPPPSGERWRQPRWLEVALRSAVPEVSVRFWSSTRAAEVARRLLQAPANLGEGLRACQTTLVHGDCHTDNLLLDGDEVVWADWQSVGVGHPAGDLTFLWQRAQATAADPPQDAMLEAYAAARSIDLVAFRRSVLATELGSLLYGWPEHAHHLSASEQDRLACRLLDVAKDWEH